MAYVKNDPAWVEGGAPGISAERLNHMETQYDEVKTELATPSGDLPVDARNIINDGAESGLDADTLDGRHLADLFIPALFTAIFRSGTDGNVVISSNSTIPRRVMCYDNLTVNSGITLSTMNGLCIIAVKGTLTLNGTISANGKGAAGGSAQGSGAGYGGAGGGFLLVIANAISGSGTISANGDNGTDAGTYNFQYSGKNGSSGQAFGVDIPGGLEGSYDSPSGGTAPTALVDLFQALLNAIAPTDIGAGGGGSGESGSGTRNGGGGGAGICGSGGTGGLGASASTGIGCGGGGGGGGAVIVICMSSIPEIEIYANGGAGGTGWAGGGGGGGGLAMAIAPASSAVLQANGGAAGTNTGGGTPPVAGSPGVTKFVALA